MSFISNKAAIKKRNQGSSYSGILSHPTQAAPPSTPVPSNPYAPQAVPSNGPGALYVPEHYMSTTTKSPHMYFTPNHNATSIHSPVPSFDPGYVAGTGASHELYQGYQQTGFSNAPPQNTTVPLYPSQHNPYGPHIPAGPPSYHNTPFGYPIEEKPQYTFAVNSMQVDSLEDKKRGNTPNSPPLSPARSISADLPGSSGFVDNQMSPVANNDSKKPQRDPHRKQIESRAADKRKSAVKRLQNVLAARTRGLPENGLANQLHMAADQLEEDGKLIVQLKKENHELKKKVSQLESEQVRK